MSNNIQERNTITLDPKTLFLIDGLGALLSAFLLGVVLVRLEHIFGIPKQTLYILAIFPCFFAIYDLYWYASSALHKAPFLKFIALANLLYCVLSIGLALSHFNELTYWGWVYIFGEIVIVLSLAIFEWSTAIAFQKQEK